MRKAHVIEEQEVDMYHCNDLAELTVNRKALGIQLGERQRSNSRDTNQILRHN
jgi:hypothetical protein